MADLDELGKAAEDWYEKWVRAGTEECDMCRGMTSDEVSHAADHARAALAVYPACLRISLWQEMQPEPDEALRQHAHAIWTGVFRSAVDLGLLACASPSWSLDDGASGPYQYTERACHFIRLDKCAKERLVEAPLYRRLDEAEALAWKRAREDVHRSDARRREAGEDERDLAFHTALSRGDV
jgi:hypothetical protein